MKQTRNGSANFAKGLIVGSVLVAAAAMFYIPKRRNGLLKVIAEVVEPLRSKERPDEPKSIEKEVIVEEAAKPKGVWRAMFYVASAVAMISDWRMNANIEMRRSPENMRDCHD